MKETKKALVNKKNQSSISTYLNKFFKLKENKSNIKTEILAGITTFATMAYVLAVVPGILKSAGAPGGASLTILLLMIFACTMAMGLYTNRPFALAPGLGSVAIFAITMIKGEGIPWEIASGMIFISGVIFIIVSFGGIREFIVKLIPVSIKVSISAGIGLFISLLGFRSVGIIVADSNKNVLAFGDLTQPVVILAVIGLIIIIVLDALKVKGSFIIGIIVTTIIGIPMGITQIPNSLFSMPTGFSELAFKVNPIGALNVKYLPFLFAFFIPDFFSTLGTVLGVGEKAGFLDEEGNLEGIDKCFKVDSISTLVGSLFGMPCMTTYLESAAGVEQGGRTGLTAVTTAFLFLLMLFFTPLALMLPVSATAPVLMLIGMKMLSGMRKIDYENITEYLPAFICITLTIFTFNVGNGISAAMIVYVILKITTGKMKELLIGHYVLAAVLVYYFYVIATT
ncbi:NCS2 family permease [Clostridium bowmanii]|uniref:NCS2 family permease n=1 Tax=Clostridium bowmanii TaxID=132925 RepID=UPI001C0BB6B4|nr:NCS2 family permease [Clostridium bowmanii]MBU3191524.1 NCS2 family permease [Clostridium bowmanii]MCA1075877.1 NCS2 family permease [Clostridium bowmanii]